MYKTDDGNFVDFYEKAIENKVASEEQGRPIFNTAIMAKVVCPGQKNQEMHHELIRYAEPDKEGGEPSIMKKNEGVMMRFRRQYEAWKEGRESVELNGTPLSEFPALTASQRATMERLEIYTVDQLADVPDGALGDMGMGAREIREKAKAYLESASGGAGVTKLAAENERLKEEMEMLKEQVKELSALAEEATKPKKGGK